MRREHMDLLLAVVLCGDSARIAEGTAAVGGRDDDTLPLEGDQQRHARDVSGPASAESSRGATGAGQGLSTREQPTGTLDARRTRPASEDRAARRCAGGALRAALSVSERSFRRSAGRLGEGPIYEMEPFGTCRDYRGASKVVDVLEV